MIVPYTKVDKLGNKVTYFTHTSFLDQEKLAQATLEISRSYKSWQNFTIASVIGGLFVNSFSFAKFVPKSVPCYGLAAVSGLAGFALGYFAFVSGTAENKFSTVFNNSTFAYWKEKRNVVSLDRAFFHLNDDQHNNPCLFHHGLSPERAASMIPDGVEGPAVPAPVNPEHHH